jgi:hypothetical protein
LHLQFIAHLVNLHIALQILQLAPEFAEVKLSPYIGIFELEDQVGGLAFVFEVDRILLEF